MNIISSTPDKGLSPAVRMLLGLGMLLAAILCIQLVTAQAAHAQSISVGAENRKQILNHADKGAWTNADPSNGSGGSAPPNPNVKYLIAGCTSVGGNTCSTEEVVVKEENYYVERCTSEKFALFGSKGEVDGTRATLASTSASSAITYVHKAAGSNWNSDKPAEKMIMAMSYRISGKGWPNMLGTGQSINMPARSDLAWNKKLSSSAGGFSFYRFCAHKALDLKQNVEKRSFVCGPGGRNPTYPASIGAAVRLDRLASSSLGIPTVSWYFGGYNCLYVAADVVVQPIAVSTVECYYTPTFRSYYSTSRASINSGGANLDSKTFNRPSAPYTRGNTLQNCTTAFTEEWDAPLHQYGYYRLTGTYKVKIATEYRWPSWTANPDVAKYELVDGTPRNVRGWFAYSCTGSNASTIDGLFNSHSALPAQGARIFDISDCAARNGGWKCAVDGKLTIAGTTSPAEVMRDGDNVPLGLPGLRITGPNVRDISGASSVQSRNTYYLLNVAAGSSPSNNKNQNAAKQYYQMFKGDGKTKEQFGTWRPDANNNRSKFLNYFWSTDNGGSWKMTWDGRFNADFKVPRRGTLHGGMSYVWVRDNNVVCGGKQTSNPVTVIRSVNSSNR